MPKLDRQRICQTGTRGHTHASSQQEGLPQRLGNLFRVTGQCSQNHQDKTQRDPSIRHIRVHAHNSPRQRRRPVLKDQVELLALAVVCDEIALQPERELHSPTDGQNHGAERRMVRTEACEIVEREIEKSVAGADDGGDGEVGYIPAVIVLQHRALRLQAKKCLKDLWQYTRGGREKEEEEEGGKG